MLLTRPPLYSPPEGDFLVRLACVKHAASVYSEPGSNSPIQTICFPRKIDVDQCYRLIIFKAYVHYIRYEHEHAYQRFQRTKKMF